MKRTLRVGIIATLATTLAVALGVALTVGWGDLAAGPASVNGAAELPVLDRAQKAAELVEVPAEVPADAPVELSAEVPVERAGELSAPRRRAAKALPLAGKLIVVDAGHQLGNHNFPAQVNRQVPAGGFTKPCNTTGTSTNAGYPEATFTWRVSRLVVRQLTDLGARVVETRHRNSQRAWGPCVDVRGRAGNKRQADLKLSIHADGSYAAGAHGFHVIAPTDRKPWSHDIFRDSRRYAKITRASLHRSKLPYATYLAGGDGLDFRSDLATLNLSDVPTILVELGNMRDALDAGRMTSPQGRRTYADALVRGIRVTLR